MHTVNLCEKGESSAHIKLICDVQKVQINATIQFLPDFFLPPLGVTSKNKTLNIQFISVGFISNTTFNKILRIFKIICFK